MCVCVIEYVGRFDGCHAWRDGSRCVARHDGGDLVKRKQKMAAGCACPHVHMSYSRDLATGKRGGRGGGSFSEAKFL